MLQQCGETLVRAGEVKHRVKQHCMASSPIKPGTWCCRASCFRDPKVETCRILLRPDGIQCMITLGLCYRGVLRNGDLGSALVGLITIDVVAHLRVTLGSRPEVQLGPAHGSGHHGRHVGSSYTPNGPAIGRWRGTSSSSCWLPRSCPGRRASVSTRSPSDQSGDRSAPQELLPPSTIANSVKQVDTASDREVCCCDA